MNDNETKAFNNGCILGYICGALGVLLLLKFIKYDKNR